jgi:hypothetical protein
LRVRFICGLPDEQAEHPDCECSQGRPAELTRRDSGGILLRGVCRFMARHEIKTGVIPELGPGAAGVCCHILLHTYMLAKFTSSGSDLDHSKARLPSVEG